MPEITFKNPDGSKKTVKATVGHTVMRVAQQNELGLEGACEGSMICSTCHVIVDQNWFSKLGPASEEEKDLLDLAVELTACSRLGCQIVMTDSLDGIEVTLPSQTANLL